MQHYGTIGIRATLSGLFKFVGFKSACSTKMARANKNRKDRIMNSSLLSLASALMAEQWKPRAPAEQPEDLQVKPHLLQSPLLSGPLLWRQRSHPSAAPVVAEAVQPVASADPRLLLR